jgi:hypothetical protein
MNKPVAYRPPRPVTGIALLLARKLHTFTRNNSSETGPVAMETTEYMWRRGNKEVVLMLDDAPRREDLCLTSVDGQFHILHPVPKGPRTDLGASVKRKFSAPAED